MKIKLLAIIASLFILPLAITSCLDSDNEYELGTDDTISAFALDTIYGVNYKFTIDQIRKEIYNQDSVPFGSDTIIDNILIKTLSYYGWVVTGDSLFIQSDSVDFSKTSKESPLEFDVYAPTGETSNTYKIWVNRHQIDPDSLVWGENPYADQFSASAIPGGQETKTVSLANDMLVYTTDGTSTTLYSKANHWQETSTNLGIAPMLSSITNFNGTLYVPLADGTMWHSSDGANWESVSYPGFPADISSTTFKVKTIITTFYDMDNKDLDKTLACIIEDEYGISFATAAISSPGELTWERGEKVPYTTLSNSPKFPTGRLSATKSFTTSTGGQQAMLIGNPLIDDTATTPWFSNDGLNWGPLEIANKYALPKWNEPTILYYGNTLYAFGGAYDSSSENDFSTIYTSVNGLAWTKIKRGFLFPNEDGVSKFKDRTGYSLVVDKDNYIWMTWGKENEIWRGKLNRLTFIKQ